MVALMKASAPHPAAPTKEGEQAARIAELTELLGHLTTSWDEERRQLARRLHDSL